MYAIEEKKEEFWRMELKSLLIVVISIMPMY